MRELSLHILDIAENSISAGATQIEITVIEDLLQDELWITVQDNGRGMDSEMVKRVIDPFVTSRTTRKVGLGIPLLKDAAEACNGFFTIDSEIGKGTTIRTKFQHSHIDRMPLGDLAETFLTLLIGTPEVHWIFTYKVNDQVFLVDDQEIKEVLNGISLTDSRVIEYLNHLFREGIAETKESAVTQGAQYANH